MQSSPGTSTEQQAELFVRAFCNIHDIGIAYLENMMGYDGKFCKAIFLSFTHGSIQSPIGIFGTRATDATFWLWSQAMEQLKSYEPGPLTPKLHFSNVHNPLSWT